MPLFCYAILTEPPPLPAYAQAQLPPAATLLRTRRIERPGALSAKPS